MKIRILLFTISLIFYTPSIAGADYNYEILKFDDHKIHIVTINPKEYEISLVSSHNQVFGRERIESIAKRENADIAINSGFFQIGDNEDGRPSGTLIINGQVIGLRITEHACLIKRDGKVFIEVIKPALEVKIGNSTFVLKKFNKFTKQKGIYFFSRSWGVSTLTAYKEHKELVISKDLKIIENSPHGNNKIPEDGYVLSFPINQDLSGFIVGEKVEFNWNPPYLSDNNTSAVMGIPALIIDGKIKEGLSDGEKHARTAFGIKADGSVVVAVVEHVYSMAISDLTLVEVREIITKKNLSFNDLKASEIKKIVSDHLTTDSTEIGFSVLELANFMHKQGCISAINLDGGGSTSLYMKGKYINKSIGDKDEAAGQAVVRPVSDAIVFRKQYTN